MTLKECYAALEGNYDEVIGRMLTEERVKKFLKMFLADPSFNELCDAFISEDYETAFRAAHTLKGTCSNLSLSKLNASASEITEALRGGVNKGADLLLPNVISDYNQTINAIKQLD